MLDTDPQLVVWWELWFVHSELSEPLTVLPHYICALFIQLILACVTYRNLQAGLLADSQCGGYEIAQDVDEQKTDISPMPTLC